MKYRQLCLVAIAVAVAGFAGVSSALAAAVNPFPPSVADIQALGDNTSGFSSGAQLSTIDAIHTTPDGILVDVTWRIGTGSDPFGAFPGETFARVVLTRYTNSEDTGLGRLLSPPYDGIKWSIASDHPVGGQPYIQTAPDWVYYQPPALMPIPGDLSYAPVTLSFDDARNFAGKTPNTIVHPDANGQIRSNSFGLQLYAGFGLTPGQPVPGHILITQVPEPSTSMLLLMGAVGLVGRARQRKG
jgi:hypothetical protein